MLQEFQPSQFDAFNASCDILRTVPWYYELRLSYLQAPARSNSPPLLRYSRAASKFGATVTARCSRALSGCVLEACSAKMSSAVPRSAPCSTCSQTSHAHARDFYPRRHARPLHRHWKLMACMPRRIEARFTQGRSMQHLQSKEVSMLSLCCPQSMQLRPSKDIGSTLASPGNMGSCSGALFSVSQAEPALPLHSV